MFPIEKEEYSYFQQQDAKKKNKKKEKPTKKSKTMPTGHVYL